MALNWRNVVTYADTAANSANVTYTQAYTLGTSTDWLLVAVQSEGRVTASPPADVTSVKWNGVALTKIDEQISPVDATPEGVTVEWWGVHNPGNQGETHNITVETSTASGGHDLSSMSFTIYEVYGGADSSIATIAKGTSTLSTSLALNITTTAAGSIVLSSASQYNGSGGPYTPGTDITETVDSTTGASATSDHTYWSGAKVQGSINTYAVGCVSTGSAQNGAIMAIEIKPAPAGSTVPKKRDFYQQQMAA